MTKTEEKTLAYLREQESPVALERVVGALALSYERAFTALEALVFYGRVARIEAFTTAGKGTAHGETRSFWIARRNWERLNDAWTFDPEE